MKNKRWLSTLTACAMAALLPTTALAATPQEIMDWGEGTKISVEKGQDGVYTLTLTGDASQDLVIDGETVVLNLNGHTLTNFTDGCSAIHIKSGSLTIGDSSEEGTGVIKQKSANKNVPLIGNSGSLTIENGTFEQGQAYGVIVSQPGSDTDIAGGVFTQSANSPWSIVDNKGNMSISGGDFTGGATPNALWVIRNESNLAVTGGRFSSVSGGAVIGTTKEGDNAPNSEASTKISGGDFSSVSTAFYVHGGNDKGAVSLDVQKVGSLDTGSGVLVRANASASSGGVPANVTVAPSVAETVTNLVDMLDPAASAATVDGALYLGDSKEVAQTAAGAKNTVSVLAGNLTLENLPEHVLVSNNSDGKVVVNGSDVPKGETVGHVHKAVHVPAVSATVGQAGNKEYWYCEGCGKYFADAALSQEITKADTVIPALRDDDDSYDGTENGYLLSSGVGRPSSSSNSGSASSAQGGQSTGEPNPSTGGQGLQLAACAAALCALLGGAITLPRRRR